MTLKRDKLIQIDDKLYQKCKVHLLPTNGKSKIWSGIKEPLECYTHEQHAGSPGQAFHLYITSDEEIKEGDWIFDQVNNYIEKCSSLGIEKSYGWRKIIATTDTSLEIGVNQCDGCNRGIPIEDEYSHKDDIICQKDRYIKGLPQPSQDFLKVYIEKYNKGEQIIDVLVEYENINKGFQQLANQKDSGSTIIPDNYQLKTDKNNTITIKAVKDNYTRLEVCNIVRDVCNVLGVDSQYARDYIKENL